MQPSCNTKLWEEVRIFNSKTLQKYALFRGQDIHLHRPGTGLYALGVLQNPSLEAKPPIGSQTTQQHNIEYPSSMSRVLM
eukprot:6473223-Amphidinium_carterae.1